MIDLKKMGTARPNTTTATFVKGHLSKGSFRRQHLLNYNAVYIMKIEDAPIVVRRKID